MPPRSNISRRGLWLCGLVLLLELAGSLVPQRRAVVVRRRGSSRAAHDRRADPVDDDKAAGKTRKTLSRRSALAAATTTALAASFAQPAAAERWVTVAGDVSARPGAAFQAVDSTYGLLFVEYLARLLLRYDPQAVTWWDGVRRSAAAYPSAVKQEQRRFDQYGKFVSSVELDLFRNFPEPSSKLLDAVQSRLPNTLEAQRQLPILCALSKKQIPGETELIGRLANRSVFAVELVDRGSFATSSPPLLSIGKPVSLDDAAEARLIAKTRPTGRVLGVDVPKNLNFLEAPAVRFEGSCNRSAVARAIVENGTVKIVIDDAGSGYEKAPTVFLEGAALKATLEYELAAVEIVGQGRGYSAETTEITFKGEMVRPPKVEASLQGPARIKTGFNASSYASSSEALTRLLSPRLQPRFDNFKRRYVIDIPELDDPEITGVETTLFGPRGQTPVTVEATVSAQQYLALALCGAVCTMGAHVVLTPLELVKTKLQTSPGDASPLDVAKDIVKEDGVKGLFTGADSIALGYFVSGFFGFGLTEVFKRNLEWPLALDDIAWASTVVASLAASIVATTAVTPFETAKVRLMTSSGGENLLETWTALAQERGGVFEGLFGRALAPLIYKDIIFAAFKFAAFDACRQLFSSAITSDSALSSLLITLLSGATAGILGSVASHPIDTAFAKIETASEDTTVLAALQEVNAEKGLGGIYAGVAARALFCGLLIAIEFAIFENLRDALHISRDDFAYALEALSTAATQLQFPPQSPL